MPSVPRRKERLEGERSRPPAAALRGEVERLLARRRLLNSLDAFLLGEPASSEAKWQQ